VIVHVCNDTGWCVPPARALRILASNQASSFGDPIVRMYKNEDGIQRRLRIVLPKATKQQCRQIAAGIVLQATAADRLD
jgi:hypothetical protein